MKFLADIEVEEGLKDSSGDLGSNGQVLSSTGSGTNWITSTTGVTSLNTFTGAVSLVAGTNINFSASLGSTITINASGGGGTIGGTVAITELAVGDATDSIDGSSKLTFAYVGGGAGYDKLRIGDGTTGSNQVLLEINTLGTGSSRGRLTLKDAGTFRGFLGITGGDEEVTLLSNDNLILDCNGDGTGGDIIMTSNTASNVGIGNTAPDEKLHVTGRIKASKGVQVGGEADNDAASGLVGTFRYRLVNGSATAGTNYSYVDMCMQTDTTGGLTSYAWVNIVTNRW